MAALVLMSVLLLAFFSRSLLNRQVAYSSTNLARTDLLARASLDYVVGELREEIQDPARSTNFSGRYLPLLAGAMVPDRTTVGMADALGRFTVAKVSAAETSLRPGGPVLGSSDPVSAPGVGGRFVSSNRWFGSGGPRLGSQTVLPAWIYVTRGLGVSAAPSVFSAKARSGPDFVVGRFACTVYEVGGLLNANVAGFNPLSESTNFARFKSSLSYADLTGLDATVNMAKFIGWRNGMSGANAVRFDEWATGNTATNGGSSAADILARQAGSLGHTVAAQGDNAFVSRRDLLRATNSAVGLTAAAVQYLSHRSRTSGAPSTGPTADSTGIPDYLGGQKTSPRTYKASSTAGNPVNPAVPLIRHVASGTLTRYLDDGTPETYAVRPGDPLVQRRFSLAKLAWLGHDGPNSAAFSPTLTSAQQARAIQDCFGLTWDTGGSFPRWKYDHDPGTTTFNILTLAEVRDEFREPDFFEFLKAGILNGPYGTDTTGSLARSPGPVSASQNPGSAGVTGRLYEGAPTTDPDVHLLQIGANIIDQSDTDGFPTAIHFAYPQNHFDNAIYGAEEREYFCTVLGVENIPYLLKLWNPCMVFHSMDISGWWGFEFWNPHRQATGGGLRPSIFRIRAYGAAQTTWAGGASEVASNEWSPLVEYETPAGEDVRHLVFRDTGQFVDTPKRVTLEDVVASLMPENSKNLYRDDGTFPFSSPKLAGILAGEVSAATYNRTQTVSEKLTQWNSSYLNARSMFTAPATFLIQYQDADGAWRPASMMGRQWAFYRNSFGISGSGVNGSPLGRSANARLGDPRMDRLSSSHAEDDWKTGTGMSISGSTVNFTVVKGALPIGQGFYFRPGQPTQGFVSFPLLQFNLQSKSVSTWAAADSRGYFTDPDGVVRPADGFRQSGSDGALLLPSGATHVRRPVILDRPFASVAELGAVFRDLPFRSLDFWSKGSADSALLDLFSVGDQPATSAGTVNLNSAPPAVLGALFKGAARHPTDTIVYPLIQSEADALGSAVSGFLSGNKLASRAELVTAGSGTNYLADVINGAFGPVSNQANKNVAEAPIRALAGVADVRTWNLLVDVVAQTGRVSSAATSLADFHVEGEKRYWLHLVVDRFTGKVIEQNLEPVFE